MAISIVDRIVGQFATASIQSSPSVYTQLFNLTEWEVTIESEVADVTAHGDFWEVNVPLKQSWRGRMKGFVALTGVASYMAAFAQGSGGDYRDPVLIYFTGYNTSTPPGAGTVQGAGNIIFQGQGFVTRGNISMPMAMGEQEIEITGSGSPTVIA